MSTPLQRLSLVTEQACYDILHEYIYHRRYIEFRQATKPYHTDQRIVSRCQCHVIFCPKYRRKVLNEVRAVRLKELIVAKQEDYGYTMIEMEVTPDHVHLLLDVDPREGSNGIVAKMKGFTSHELREEYPG